VEAIAEQEYQKLDLTQKQKKVIDKRLSLMDTRNNFKLFSITFISSKNQTKSPKIGHPRLNPKTFLSARSGVRTPKLYLEISRKGGLHAI